MPTKPIRIGITSGDPDGIGTEIVGKALAKLGPQPGVHFYLFRSTRCPPKHLGPIDAYFRRQTVSTWPEALQARFSSHREIVDINSTLPAARWVEQVARASVSGHLDAIATAPLSKTQILKAGLPYIGHTEILKKIAQSDDLFMGFVGKEFNVLLATGHIPLKEVSRTLSADLLVKAIHAASDLRKWLPKKQAARPMALVGLNPHAGETGIIGDEENEIFKKALERARKSRLPIEGPLVPDAAFQSKNWKEYSVFVCPYHDQGLIPFKMIHGQNTGLHITMGLPFVRTSVDHGTAKDIFGRNRANPNSMLEALKWAIKLSQSRRVKS